jgi:hypothetical protein
MPDRLKGRGQTKCGPWFSRFGVGSLANDSTPEKFTVAKPQERVFFFIEEAKSHKGLWRQ